MRLICPNCVAQYEVDENVIPAEGRDVQCANCGHNWFQDTIQMLSSEADIASGKGDPDSDVPAELFNDLEGKLKTAFVSKRKTTAPDPNDMEPENPRDDFQIEQEPATPSSKLDQNALDILHAEVEYSSGEKPPAITEKPDPKEETPAPAPVETPEVEAEDIPEATEDEAVEGTAEEPAKETSYMPVEDPIEEATKEAVEEAPSAAENDDLDEIRRRIQELEAPETAVESSPDILDMDTTDLEPATQAPARENPFSRPASNTKHTAPQSRPPAAPLYMENIPPEESNAPVVERDQTINREIEDLVASQDIPDIASDSSVSAHPDTYAGNTADLYGAADKQPSEDPVRTERKRSESPKDMFQDVDELSSEIASEAEQDPDDHHPTAVKSVKKTSGGFMKGFKYALLFYILIGALYMFQSVILEYIPQAEGFLSIITTLVELLNSLFSPLIENIKGMLD